MKKYKSQLQKISKLLKISKLQKISKLLKISKLQKIGILSKIGVYAFAMGSLLLVGGCMEQYQQDPLDSYPNAQKLIPQDPSKDYPDVRPTKVEYVTVEKPVEVLKPGPEREVPVRVPVVSYISEQDIWSLNISKTNLNYMPFVVDQKNTFEVELLILQNDLNINFNLEVDISDSSVKYSSKPILTELKSETSDISSPVDSKSGDPKSRSSKKRYQLSWTPDKSLIQSARTYQFGWLKFRLKINDITGPEMKLQLLEKLKKSDNVRWAPFTLSVGGDK